MKLGNEKKEVFKDPSPITSLRDVGTVLGSGLMGAGAGAVTGVFGAVGVTVAMSAMGNEKQLLPMVAGGAVIGAVTGAAAGVAIAISGLGFDKMVDQAREIAKAPGFDRTVLDTPVKGLKVAESFVVHKKPSVNTAGAYLAGGLAGVAIASYAGRAKQADYDQYAMDPNHRHGDLVGHWDGKKSLLLDIDDRCRNSRDATLRDVIEFKDQIAGKEILREFIQTGRVDSFQKVSPKAEASLEDAERTAGRLAGFMKSSLKTGEPTPIRNSPRPG